MLNSFWPQAREHTQSACLLLPSTSPCAIAVYLYDCIVLIMYPKWPEADPEKTQEREAPAVAVDLCDQSRGQSFSDQFISLFIYTSKAMAKPYANTNNSSSNTHTLYTRVELSSN